MTSFHQLFKLAPAAVVAAALCLSAPGNVNAQAQAQPLPQAPAQAPPDQVTQLAQLIGLSDEQQTDIRAVMSEMGGEIETLQARAETLNRELEAHVGPDFDEDEVRATAAQLGEVSGEIAAKSVILQSTVEGIFTEEQRDRLDELEAQQRQQQELQQQQLQQQLEQQFQQQQQQPAEPAQEAPQPQQLPAPQQP